MINNNLPVKFANFAVLFVLLCIAFANFAVSGATLEYNQLELKDGKVLTFVSCSKVDKDTLRVILTSGRGVKVTRFQVSNAEVERRFKLTFKMHYGKAYYVKSKLPATLRVMSTC
jgi:hypothetical protein